MNRALIISDMQEITVGKKHSNLFNYDENLIEKINKYIKYFDNDNVIYIRNIMKNNLINKLTPVKCYKGTFESELVENLNIVSNNIFDKYEGNAFSNKKLNDYLKTNNIDELELVGVDGGGCISLTAFGAIKEDYHVIINEKLVGTMFNSRKEKYFKKLKKIGVKFQ